MDHSADQVVITELDLNQRPRDGRFENLFLKALSQKFLFPGHYFAVSHMQTDKERLFVLLS